VIAEHRLHYIKDLADRVLYMRGGALERIFSGSEFFSLSEVELSALHLRSFSAPAPLVPRAPRTLSHNFIIKNVRPNIQEFSVETGTAVAVTGNNGAGKTAFARALCGLEKNDRSVLVLDGKIISRKDRLKRCYMVMQDVNSQLFTESVLDEVLLGMKNEDENGARAILASLDLAQFTTRHPQSLSGGQKQRLAIAAALAAERDIIVLDEPSSGLDLTHMKEVAAAISSLVSQKKTVFVITHDGELARAACSRSLRLEEAA
ncbi:MAG: ATP-binding cassette domain-containing protein, partial [Spirochaetaceae bacterium]|nr:ATP-binding cassette domain-containing protein [Spirochaetaceae bacterium]